MSHIKHEGRETMFRPARIINRKLTSFFCTIALFTSLGVSSNAYCEPFIGEIRMFAGTFAPRNWAFCNGQMLPIAENTALYSLLGTTYGGDGRVYFGLPDLRGRFPMHAGNGPGLTPHFLGQSGGEERTTLNVTNMPAHNHTATVTLGVNASEATETIPNGNFLAKSGNGGPIYAKDSSNVPGTEQPQTMNSSALQTTILNNGGGQAFSNVPPYNAVNFIIALQGTYPPRP